MKGHLEVDPVERCKWRGEEWTRKKTCRAEERMWEETVTTGKSEEHKWETVATRRPMICSKCQITCKLSMSASLDEVTSEMKPRLGDQQAPQKRPETRKERRRGGERRRSEKRGRVQVRRGSRGLWDIIATPSCAAECVSSVVDDFRSGDCKILLQR